MSVSADIIEILHAELHEVEAELAEAIRTIKADHNYLASQGGSPCQCKWCKPEEES